MTKTIISVKAEDLKKLDLNEGSVLVLTVKSDIPLNVLNQAAGILETVSKRVIGFRPQVVVMPDVYKVDKLSLGELEMLKAKVDSLIAYHTRRINVVKESGDA